jgi:DNA (cytosine-5)-methyltransferase 1
MGKHDRFTIIDFFCAPGGFTLGFELAGFRPLAGVDKNPSGVLTYHHNFPEACAITADIEKLSSVRLMKEIEISRGQVDVIIGGPPCQGFSNIGRVKIASLIRGGFWNLTTARSRFINDPRNVLYKEFVRMVRDLKPKFFVMENVPGMMSYRNGEIVREIIGDFRRIGYYTESKVLDSINFGVPQRRKRIFFIGTLLPIKKIIWPKPSHSDFEMGMPSLNEFIKTVPKENLKPCITVWEAIGDLPYPVRGKPYLNDLPLNYKKPASGEYQRWVRKGSDQVHNHISRNHSEQDIGVFRIMKEGMRWKDLPDNIKKLYGYRDDIFHDKIKRLSRKKPSWTVMAHLHKDGYMYIHPTQSRSITVREAARLQSFPDRFIFMASRTSQFIQVGNAVPPLLAKAVATVVKRMLESALS